MVAFVAPTPSPIRTMAIARPGTPAPRSNAIGKEVINMTKDPRRERLCFVSTGLVWERRGD